MKKISIILLVFSLSGSLWANQQLIDSLRTVVLTQSKEEKLTTLNRLSRALLEINNLKEAASYQAEALNMAQATNNPLALAEAYDNEGLIFQAKYDYENAMMRFVDALKIRNEQDNQAGIASSKNNIGKIFFLQEDESNAILNLMTALNIRKELKDKKGAAETHKNLADVYLFKQLYGTAKDHYEKAKALRIELRDLQAAADIASFLGNILRDIGDYDGAIHNFNMSLDLNRSIEAPARIAEDYNNLTNVYIAEEAYEEAEEYNNDAFNIRSKLKNQLGMAESYMNYGFIYAKTKRTKQAEESLEKSASLLRSLGMEPGVQYIYRGLSDIYKEMQNFPKAYEYQLAYSESRDFIFNKEKSTALLELTTKYESEFAAEKQKQQIAVLEKDKAFGNRIRYFLLGLVALGALLLINLFVSYRRKQKDNQLLLAKNEEINRQNEEIDFKNLELKEKNNSLDVVNQKLVTEMAERESIEQSSFARDRFLATMSHEMRTPMNIIIGLTHLLLEENPRKDQIEHLRTLQFSANNLVVFINDVLDFSKIEAGKLSLENREFSPRKIFNEIEQRFQLPATDKGLTFNGNFDSKLPKLLLGDPTRLNQIMTNLVSNAVKYTQKGQINLSVKLHELQGEEATILLKVTDTGSGIPQDKLGEMFRKFANGNVNDIFEGYANAGLGLAITKRLVDLQNGKIEVDSKEGKGTSFTIYLPYKNVEERAANLNDPTKMKKATKNYDHLEGNKVLLVEDNKINQLVVAKMLRKLGMEVVTADHGLEALDEFATSYFDLVLMDIQMPKMDGYRTTAEIRKSPDPRKRDVPIIALTASAFLTEKEKAKLFGMNDHVGKPFGPEDLLDKISSCLTVYKA
ncbi:MAG: tetratricopeptide repeat protein [Saprospiraceae bacterium]